MRVFVADAEPNVRAALRILLNQERDMRVVGQASRAQGLTDWVRATHPDLVLLDWELPGGAMHDLLPALRGASGRLSILVLGVQPEMERSALAAGADAFVAKTDSPERLLEALRSVNTGRRKSEHGKGEPA